jgi:hypothetical protein
MNGGSSLALERMSTFIDSQNWKKNLPIRCKVGRKHALVGRAPACEAEGQPGSILYNYSHLRMNLRRCL